MKGKRNIAQHWRGFVILSVFIFQFLPSNAQIGMRELGDSLMTYTGFSKVWSPIVRVKKLRVDGNNVSVYTNAPLSHVHWTPASLRDIKRRVSRWVLGHSNGDVTIYSGQTDIESLLTDCGIYGVKDIRRTEYEGVGREGPDLTERNIVLWPSHGLYFNKSREEWIWQRATLWTTVEDLYSQEYVRLIRQMLENAGATVYMPRAGLEQQETGVSGMPQWTEGARYWLISQGADSTVWNLYDGDEYKDDMKCRAMWVNSLDVPIDICLAIHTDGQDSGNDTTTIGTLCIYTGTDDEGNKQLRDGRNRELVNRNYADWIQTQIVEDVRHIAPNWTRRQLQEANYCESRVPVVPSVLLEILSHKNMADMKYGLDPQFRFTVARAVYKGMLKYLNGRHAVVQPLPVQQMAISPDGLLRWKAENDPLEPSATPSYYMVYVQEDEGEWNVQQVDKCELRLSLKPDVQVNCYVVAGNEGGLSLPSPMVSAYSSKRNSESPVLIVDGFDDSYGPDWFIDSTYAGIVPGSYACEDRMSCAYIGQQWDYTRAHPWVNDDNCGWGASYRDHAGTITVGNTRDWSVRHGRVLKRMGISYVSCTEGMLETITNNQSPITNNLLPFTLIDFVCGRQRKPLRPESRQVLAQYLTNGGRLLLSTDHFSAIDPKWAKQYLHAKFYAANVTQSGRIRSEHRPFKLQLTPNEEQLFTCTPEGLMPLDGAVKTATYEDMRCPAAVGYKSPITNNQSPITLVYGFPLEAVTDFDHIYRHSIEWLKTKE